MLRRLFLVALVAPLMLVIASGCGGGGAEAPKAQNSNVKPMGLKTKTGDKGGADDKSVVPTD